MHFFAPFFFWCFLFKDHLTTFGEVIVVPSFFFKVVFGGYDPDPDLKYSKWRRDDVRRRGLEIYITGELGDILRSKLYSLGPA